MAKPVFKSYTQGQSVLFPASLDEKLPPDSPARLINHIVDNLDISRVIDTYKFGGRSAYHPRMMLKVVISGNIRPKPLPIRVMEVKKITSSWNRTVLNPSSNTTIFIRNRQSRSKTTVFLPRTCITTLRGTITCARWGNMFMSQGKGEPGHGSQP